MKKLYIFLNGVLNKGTESNKKEIGLDKIKSFETYIITVDMILILENTFIRMS